MSEKTVIESVLNYYGTIVASVAAAYTGAVNWWVKRWINKKDENEAEIFKRLNEAESQLRIDKNNEQWHERDFSDLKKTVGDMPKIYAKVQDVTSLAAKLDKHDAENKKQIEEHDKNVKRIEAKYDEQLVNLQKSTLDAINNLGELIRKAIEQK